MLNPGPILVLNHYPQTENRAIGRSTWILGGNQQVSTWLMVLGPLDLFISKKKKKSKN